MFRPGTFHPLRKRCRTFRNVGPLTLYRHTRRRNRFVLTSTLAQYLWEFHHNQAQIVRLQVAAHGVVFRFDGDLKRLTRVTSNPVRVVQRPECEVEP